MEKGLIEYLKDPYLVLRFQEYFGVYSITKIKDKKVVDGQNSYSYVSDKTVLSDSPKIKPRLKAVHTLKKIDDNSPKLKTSSNVISPDETNGVPASSTFAEDTLSSESDAEITPYLIKNKFWYYFFFFGTYLGDEIFYASFIPFWFWNIDGAVGRRIVMVWTIIMYIGQGIKDIICWPRPPSPPVFRLQKKWSLENGMPSTHAMVGIAIPFSIIIYTMTRYQYSVPLGVAFALFWCLLISLSRIYLGMHSVLDVVVGLVLAIALMVPVVPLVDSLDLILLTSRWSPLLLITVTIPMIVFYPTTAHWTPTRGDTTMIVSFCVGVHIGAWTNYHLGVMTEPALPPPYAIIWPSWPMFGTALLRTVIGLCSIVATMAVSKTSQHAVMRCLGITRDKRTSARNTVELCCKYLTYILMGFNILHLMPNVFNMLNIQRPTFYTEI